MATELFRGQIVISICDIKCIFLFKIESQILKKVVISEHPRFNLIILLDCRCINLFSFILSLYLKYQTNI